ncbi:MAG TPA: right-handed parallel beta-helix repeat-containing protein [Dongiaceae bacterium]|nr:right-handed parallel beta-helix repeat-containing protein [Dongiaceae bacterium]
MKLGSFIPAALFALLASTLACSSAFCRVLVVDDDKADCPAASFTKIQDAVNAASPGDIIRVCKGTYVEQVSVHIPLTIAAENGAVLMPSGMQSNTTSLFNAAPLAVALLVSDATDVTIHGLIVDGSNNGISGCAPDLFGIAFQNASGTVRRTTVRNFKLVGANLIGCQSGSGIFVESGGGQLSSVTLETNSIHDFQKNGITANEVGTSVLIRANTVTGVGPTIGAAQNGIQIGFGAAGAIRNNTVSNNVWSPCTAVATCAAVATNILVTQSDGVSISGNVVAVGQVGIFVDGNSATVANNDTSADSVFDGIRLQGSDNISRANTVVNAAEAGIYLDGNNNVIRNNTITEASVGILKTTTSSGTLIQGNSIFDSIITVQDPPSINLAKLIKPVR